MSAGRLSDSQSLLGQVQGNDDFFPWITTLKFSREGDCLGQKTFPGLTIRMETLPLYKSSTRSPLWAMFPLMDLKGRKTPKENKLKVN